MSTTQLDQVEKLLKDVLQRLETANGGLTEDQAKEIATNTIKSFLESPEGAEFARKMRFGGGDARLKGSKFDRWQLNVSDIEFAYDILSAAQARGLSSGPSQDLRNAFGDLSKAVYMTEDEIKRIDQKAIENLYPRVPRQYHKGLEAVLRAMDSGESGYGSQLIGAQYVGNLWDSARMESRVLSLIDTFEMTDPTAYIPVAADIPEMLLVSESTANNSSNYSTVKTGSNRVTLTAKKFVVHQMWSGEMEEDAILPFVPFLQQQLAFALAHYGDSLVLNGDTTNAATGNINLDDADPADTKHFLAFDGIRHAAIVDNTANAVDAAGAVTLALLKGLKGKMLDTTYLNAWGHPSNLDDLIYVADPETVDAISMLDSVLTVDKYGPRASVLTGELAKVLGHPLIASMAMSKTEADGKVSTTATNNVKGQVAAFNRRGFKAGWRRRVKIETERLPATDQTRIVASLRMGFGRYTPTGNASGIEAAAVLYNIGL